jgi:S-adenosylmethionine:tRNA ribosyltransferase-isomerase
MTTTPTASRSPRPPAVRDKKTLTGLTAGEEPWFELPDSLSATEPPEARGLARDEVRLLVASADRIRHTRFTQLWEHLAPGDVLVVNTSQTLAAAVRGVRADGRPVVVHRSSRLDDGAWVVELRPPGPASGPITDAVVGELVDLPGDVSLRLVESYPAADADRPRLWRATTSPPVAESKGYLDRHGRPISYAYVPRAWSLWAYQTVFATDPGSAEMPSAGRPFSPELVTRLVNAGVTIAPLTLHTGVSSLDDDEGPLPEPYAVPADTVRIVNSARSAGRRIVAVGTTVARALESVAGPDGTVAAGRGWTDLLLGPERPARVVDGLVTGWHAPGASHLRLLEAVAGRDLVRRAYRAALDEQYRWHEFGDSCLLLPR